MSLLVSLQWSIPTQKFDLIILVYITTISTDVNVKYGINNN